jgi:pimeloyl-ACP methyl ester carboxylesterase
MPVRAATRQGEEYRTTVSEAAERLAAPLAFLRGKGHRRIAIVSHSMGSRMANFYLRAMRRRRLGRYRSLRTLVEPAKLSMPVLDLYGEKDFPTVESGPMRAQPRLSAIKGAAPDSGRRCRPFFRPVTRPNW